MNLVELIGSEDFEMDVSEIMDLMMEYGTIEDVYERIKDNEVKVKIFIYLLGFNDGIEYKEGL